MFRVKTLRGLSLVALASFGCAPAERGETGEIEAAGSVDAFAMQVGDCFDDQSGQPGEVSDVPGVPCEEPHDNQVFAMFDLPTGTWPGDEQVSEAADEGCLDRFEAAIGATYDESILVCTTLFPTEASWEQRKDREVICVVYHMDLEKLTGSALNSGM